MPDKELTPEEQIKALQEENKKLAADLKKITDESTQKDELIKGLNESIADKDEAAMSNQKRPIIKVGKEQYSLRIPKFTHNWKGVRTEVDKDVLEKNPELAAELVKKGSGALVAIKKGGK